MFSKIKNSIVFRIGALLTAMTVLAILSMFSSFVISEMADYDAAAINVSGSLRKQSYLMLSKVLASDDQAMIEETIGKKALDQFHEILTDPVLLHGFTTQDEDSLSGLYKRVTQEWHNHMRPHFESYTPGAEKKQLLIMAVNQYVEEIDQLVLAYQHEAESKIEWLRIIQVFALFMTLLLVYVAMTNIATHVEQPLKQLTSMANRIEQGKLGEKLDINSKDELGVLASAFNSMSETLSEMYNDLEEKVDSKTKKLKLTNDSLKLLFDISRKINESDNDFDFQPVLDEVARLTGLNNLDLCLSTPESVTPYIHMLPIGESANYNDRGNCDGAHCDSCKGDSCFVTTDIAGYQIKFPLVQDEQNYGVLVVRVPFTHTLESWQHQLMQSVADQVAVALSLRNQANQERRVHLLNERTIIARELHDSLAQSLSYLKIQVTRLQKSYDKGEQGEIFQDLIIEIREGLSSAYRQLRELLSTFRLKIDGGGVKGALTDAIAQLRERSGMEINFEYEIESIPLTPNEEIHLLQVAKESLQNATHHSKGTRVDVRLIQQDNTIILEVCDDGIGIPDDPEKLNHYGLAIIKERSRHLNGELNLYRQEQGGTCVHMQFTPAELVV